MTIAESLLPEFDHEMSSLRKVIERVPDSKADWKPHPKSAAMGYLAIHLARLASLTNRIIEADDIDVGNPAGWTMPEFESAAKTVAMFDEVTKAARAALAGASDAQLMKPWSLKNNGETRFTLPKVAAYRSMVLNHIIHHRGQMTVYLRLNDIPLPGLYGPTADEPM
jgi:uncharacterized damage-inducible protein DinB